MNMGQYAHGNQPIQHMIYLYNYAAEPWKAQYWLREVMDKLYAPTLMVTVVMKITVRLQHGTYSHLWDFILFVPVVMNM